MAASHSEMQQFCKIMRQGLHTGISPVKLLQQQARSGPVGLRASAERLAKALDQGTALAEAMRHDPAFPPLVVALVEVGEETGRLTEIFDDLAKYFKLLAGLRRQFLASLTWPIFTFTAAVGVITLLILILGLIADSRGGPAIDPLGLGLVGPSGAVTFLLLVAGLVALGVGGLWWLSRRGTGLLRWPGLGPCIEALALSRLCLALSATLEAGLSPDRAIRRSFAVTDVPAYQQVAEAAAKRVKSGAEFARALTATRLFPEEFLAVVQTAEIAGTLPERLAEQAEHYGELASERLKRLTQILGGAVWAAVAVLVIIAIFRIASVYLNAINAML